MVLNEFIDQHRPKLNTFLVDFLQEQQNLRNDNNFHVYDRLINFSTNGKMLRGLFVILSVEMFGGASSKASYSAAAAMEVIQAAVLIHDDIMDNDELRRGNKTVFSQYVDDGHDKNASDPEHYGKSMGIVVGDLGFFLAFELLGRMEINEKQHIAIMRLFADELQKLCHGQMLDYEFGQLPTEPSEDEITHMYAMKTGGYTFYMPFMIGALLAGADSEELEKLKKLTKVMGTVFQIKDDELGLFGDAKKIGKPVGSDIMENKKTLFRSRLLKKASGEDLKTAKKHFGNGGVSAKDVKEVCDLIEKYGILAEIGKYIDDLSDEAHECIADLHVDQEYKDVLKELVEYNASRGK